MRQFKDNAARTWDVTVNVAALKRVRSLLNLDPVVTALEPQRLMTDPVLLCDVLYVLCKPQADAAGVTDEQFGAAMAGDAIGDATKALLEELTDFSPSPIRRANMRKAMAILEATAQETDALVEKNLNDLQPAELARTLLASVGRQSGGAPESSESTPAP